MPRRRRVVKGRRTPPLRWSVDALNAFANGRTAWEAYWGSAAEAEAAWHFLRRDDQPEYEQMWREQAARDRQPDPRLTPLPPVAES